MIKTAIFIGRQEGLAYPPDGDLFNVNFDIMESGKMKHPEGSTLLRATLVKRGFKLPLKLKEGEKVTL